MAILGNNVKGPASNSFFEGRIYVAKYTLASASTMSELHGWFGGGTGQPRIVIYADSGGAPGARLAYTNQLPCTSPDVELSQTGFSVSLPAGSYWIGWHFSGSGSGNAYTDTDGEHQGYTFGAGSTPPDPFGTPNITGTNRISCWAVVTAAASPPVAAFSGTPLSGEAPLSVAFTDASTNSPTSWAWTFGDGGTSTTQNPSHNYTTAGTYTVTLIATNTGGSDTETKAGYVVVAEPVVLPEGISLAPDDGALVANPTWERIDTTYNVQSWSIDRGRQNEMGRIDTGTARIELVDRNGDFDPTNPAGAFYGRLETGVPMGPLVQAAIALEDPVDETWSTLFRGFISRLEWTPYRTLEHANVTLELVDGLALLAACEMAPDPGGFGDEIFEGNIVFHEDSELDAIQTRIHQVLNQAHWPAELRSIYTGQVGLQQITYAPRSTALSVIQDAADATFPDIALVYVGGPRNPGEVVFRGRYARFHPDDAFYDLKNWQVGDDTSAATSPGTIVRVSPPLVASLDDTMVFTSAYATPNDPGGDMTTSDFVGQYVTDELAAATRGLRTWSAENLATRGGAGGTNALQETRLYADYVRDNMSTPQVRVGQLTIKPRRPGSPGEGATWELLCNIDISDVVHLTTVHGVTTGGGGGFDHDFFVEGIHYQARPGGTIPYVELTLDVSPRGFYDSNPFEA